MHALLFSGSKFYYQFKFFSVRLCSLRTRTTETHNILCGCRFYWNSTVKSHFLKSIFNTFPFLYKFESLCFQMHATDKGGRLRLDSYSETSQMSSSCLGASYEHARACSTSLLRESCLSPISFFSWREATIHTLWIDPTWHKSSIMSSRVIE